jgi:hypothetical protein
MMTRISFKQGDSTQFRLASRDRIQINNPSIDIHHIAKVEEIEGDPRIFGIGRLVRVVFPDGQKLDTWDFLLERA